MDVEVPAKQGKTDRQLALCAVSVPLAAAAQFAVPALLPLSAGLFAYTALPSFRGAYWTAVREKRLGADVLDSIVAAGCLATGAVFAGSVMSLCLGVGRAASQKTQQSSKKLLMSTFGKVPRVARLSRNGVEIETPIERLIPGDVVVVQAGDVVPVDGVVCEGLALVDQLVLTGTATPAEKTLGDSIFASTLVISGTASVEVGATGNATLCATIRRILNDSADYKLFSQRRRERFADKAVLPTLAIAGTALATVGPAGAMAVLYSDFRTGVRLASPLAMLAAVMQCMHRGILIKEGRSLELLNRVDTVLLDTTNLPSCDVSELGHVIARLRERGMKHIALVSNDRDESAREMAERLGVVEHFIAEDPADKTAHVEQLQRQGQRVCYIGDGIDDAIALSQADVSISLRGASSIADDTAQIVFLSENIGQLGELFDTARRLEDNGNRSWNLVVVPNLLCVAGAFTMGLGVMASLVANSMGALTALVNGMLPLRRIANEHLERELMEELRTLYSYQVGLPMHRSVIETECIDATESVINRHPRGETEYGTIRDESVEVVGVGD